jgi:hypothetical protein
MSGCYEVCDLNQSFESGHARIRNDLALLDPDAIAIGKNLHFFTMIMFPNFAKMFGW